MRKISIEVRGLCCDYAGDFVENVSHIGTANSTPMSASSVQSNVILANPLYIANLNIRLLYVIVCDVLLILYDMITHLNE